MFVSTNRIRTEKGLGDRLEKRFMERSGIEDQPGFLGFELWKDEHSRDYEEFLLVTHWDSKSAFYRWIRSDSIRSKHPGIQFNLIAGQSEFVGFEVRHVSLPPGAQGVAVPNEAFSLL